MIGEEVNNRKTLVARGEVELYKIKYTYKDF